MSKKNMVADMSTQDDFKMLDKMREWEITVQAKCEYMKENAASIPALLPLCELRDDGVCTFSGCPLRNREDNDVSD